VKGDIIGSLLDLERGEIHYFRNKKYLGIAYKNVPKGQNIAYFPAVSMHKHERVIFNFGYRPFCKKVPGVCAVNEPHSLVHNYAAVADFLCQKLRIFIAKFSDPKHSKLSDDEKYLIGLALFENLTPMFQDPYIVENYLLELLLDNL
jgi:hypothetical protein